MTLLVAKDRNPTQTGLTQREIYWLIQLGRMLRYLTGRTAGIRDLKIRKSGSLILEFSLPPSPISSCCRKDGLQQTQSVTFSAYNPQQKGSCHMSCLDQSLLLGREGTVLG